MSHELLDDPVLKPLDHFLEARSHSSPSQRLQSLKASARRFRESFLEHSPVLFCQSFDLVRLPYPVRYALRDASNRWGFLHLLNRLVVVQFQSEAGVKTLLVSPSHVEANKETPFFKRLSTMFGGMKAAENVLAPRLGTVESALASLGLKPEDVDYLTYDHLHTQDLRHWLGGAESAGYFPNAQLLIMRQEWESTKALLAPQRDWYCPDGILGVPERRVRCLDGDTLLGTGVALIHTPGHTEGNHSIVIRGEDGITVTSENGVGADCYSPAKSHRNLFRRYARDTGMEVVLNGNTLERGLDQYMSMIVEREIAGPCPSQPEFYNVRPSSEWVPHWLLYNLKPSFQFGASSFGQLQRTSH